MASSTEPPKILLTGATGYIGGTVLSTLLSSPSPPTSPITYLLRGHSRAEALTAAYGVRVQPALHADLDDVATTVALAAQHDVVINTALGYHPASAERDHIQRERPAYVDGAYVDGGSADGGRGAVGGGQDPR